MRLPSSFAIASLALFTGFTFANHATPPVRTDFSGVPSYSTVLEQAYETSRVRIETELPEAVEIEFPETFDATARIEPKSANTFLVRSWVRAQGVSGLIATIPWTAHVRCERTLCTVEQADLHRDQAR